jgi:succinoglycan biosynthesis transport protein ExoP
VNRDLAFPTEGRLPAVPGSVSPVPAVRARAVGLGPQLDAAALLRIVREWRWLILAIMVLGIAGGSSLPC